MEKARNLRVTLKLVQHAMVGGLYKNRGELRLAFSNRQQLVKLVVAKGNLLKGLATFAMAMVEFRKIKNWTSTFPKVLKMVPNFEFLEKGKQAREDLLLEICMLLCT